MFTRSLIHSILVLCFTISLLTACTPAPVIKVSPTGISTEVSIVPTATAGERVVHETEEIPIVEPTQTATELPTPLEPTPVPPTKRTYHEPEDGFTRVVIDGDPSDWTTYPAGDADPVGDSSGNVDVTHSYAFMNDTFLYMLFEVEGKVGTYVQVDVDINPEHGGWPVDYMVTARPTVDTVPKLTRFTDGESHELGNVGQIAQGEAFEMRIPIEFFEGPEPARVRIRVMDGVCCDTQWNAVDDTDPIQILHTSETDPPFQNLADLTASNSAFCKFSIQKPPIDFPPAAGISTPEGYTAEYFIPPSGLNVPSDVVATPEKRNFVTSSRANKIFEVKLDGTLSTFAESGAYALDSDASGDLYGYDFPGGIVQRFTPDGSSSLFARLPETACESTLAAAPDGTIYIGYNYCAGDIFGDGSILVIQPGGGVPQEIVTGIKQGVGALDVISDGTLYAVLGNSLAIIDPVTKNQKFVTGLPESGSTHGLVVADDGTSYFSTGDFEQTGNLYRIKPDGKSELMASFSNNGLEGLALTDDGEVLGTQRTIGGLQVVDQAGNVRTLVEPNGLVSPHTLAFSPCGELIAVNDEAGSLTLAPPYGNNIPFTKLNSFQPPQTFLAFAPEGWYVTGESAPGFPSLLKRYMPNGASETLSKNLSEVSGVAVAQDGSIYAAATGAGTISRLSPDDTIQIVAEGLRTPQALAMSPDGVLYAIIGGTGDADVFSIPPTGDRLISITPDGAVRTLANINEAADIAIGSDGSVYIPGVSEVYRLDSGGNLEGFAAGFNSARGVAFDAAGSLYVADDYGNNIVRIKGFPQGTLTGTVFDSSSGEPVGGVNVRAVLSQPPFMGILVAADSLGKFQISLAPGVYTLTLWADGYEPVVLENIVIKADEDKAIEVKL